MAITATILSTSGDNVDRTSYTTGSITPTANKLVLVWAYSIMASAPSSPTITGNGLTWVNIGSVLDSASLRRITLFRAMGASPTTGALTIDFAGQTQTGLGWSIVQYDGIDTSGANGSGSIVQTITGASAGNATSLTVTLSAFSSTSNATVGGFGIPLNTAGQPAVGSGFTATGQINQSTPNLSIGSEFNAGNDTSVDMNAGAASIPWVGIASELKSATVTTTQTQAAVSRITVTSSQTQSGKANIVVPILVDSYSETNTNTNITLDSDFPSGPPAGQTFTNLAIPIAITSAKFYMKYGAGSPTGNIYARLYAHTGTYGVNGIPATSLGLPLASSDPIAAASLGVSNSLITFKFTGINQYAMLPNTHYCIVLDGSAVGNASNYVTYGLDTTSPTASGNAVFANNTSTWSSDSTQDQPFYVYGLPIPTPYPIVGTFGGAYFGEQYLAEAPLLLTSTTKIQTSISRITASTVRTQTGISKITNKTLKTQTGVSRINIVTSKTQTGISRITNASQRTQMGLGRVQTTKTVTISGTSKITAQTARTQVGISRITAKTTQTQVGKSRITNSVLKTIPGLSRITNATSQTVTGRSKITRVTSRTISGRANIRATTVKIQTGVANIASASTTDKTQTGKARITVSSTKTQTGISRITITSNHNQSGKANIAVKTSKTITGIARLIKGRDTEKAIFAGVDDLNAHLENALIPKGEIKIDIPGRINSAYQTLQNILMDDPIALMDDTTAFMGGDVSYESAVEIADVTLVDDMPKMDTIINDKPQGLI